MQRLHRHHNNGLTLIEVMLSMLVILVIAIGVISYMYACAWNTRRADVQITATRLGQLLLESWKTTGPVVEGIWDVEAFDPTDSDFDSILPDDIGKTAQGIPGIGNELGGTRFEVTIDGAHYFITLSYRQDSPNFYLLNACVAWNPKFNSATLGSDPQQVWLSSYSIY